MSVSATCTPVAGRDGADAEDPAEPVPAVGEVLPPPVITVPVDVVVAVFVVASSSADGRNAYHAQPTIKPSKSPLAINPRSRLRLGVVAPCGTLGEVEPFDEEACATDGLVCGCVVVDAGCDHDNPDGFELWGVFGLPFCESLVCIPYVLS